MRSQYGRKRLDRLSRWFLFMRCAQPSQRAEAARSMWRREARR